MTSSSFLPLQNFYAAFVEHCLSQPVPPAALGTVASGFRILQEVEGTATRPPSFIGSTQDGYLGAALGANCGRLPVHRSKALRAAVPVTLLDWNVREQLFDVAYNAQDSAVSPSTAAMDSLASNAATATVLTGTILLSKADRLLCSISGGRIAVVPLPPSIQTGFDAIASSKRTSIAASRQCTGGEVLDGTLLTVLRAGQRVRIGVLDLPRIGGENDERLFGCLLDEIPFGPARTAPSELCGVAEELWGGIAASLRDALKPLIFGSRKRQPAPPPPALSLLDVVEASVSKKRSKDRVPQLNAQETAKETAERARRRGATDPSGAAAAEEAAVKAKRGRSEREAAGGSEAGNESHESFDGRSAEDVGAGVVRPAKLLKAAALPLQAAPPVEEDGVAGAGLGHKVGPCGRSASTADNINRGDANSLSYGFSIAADDETAKGVVAEFFGKNNNAKGSGINGAIAPPSSSTKHNGAAAGEVGDAMLEEAVLRAHERSGEGGTPTSAADFERLLLQTPHESFTWVQYMAWAASMDDITGARSIAERAIKRIPSSHSADRVNVFVAYMRLEAAVGTPQSLENVFARSLQYCDARKFLHTAYADAADSLHLHGVVDNTLRALTAAYPNEPELWAKWYQSYLGRGDPEGARQLARQALATVQRSAQRSVIVALAVAEFKHPAGSADRGAELFEMVLSKWPKKLDVWTVYADMLTKRLKNSESAGSSKFAIDAVRAVYTRAVGVVRSKGKSMQYFFQKWNVFEEEFGTPASVEKVHSHVIEYLNRGGATAGGGTSNRVAV